IVRNGWWKLFMAHKTKEGYFDKAEELNHKMLSGDFPEEIKEQFQLMLEYFGQSPIIVRSSSLLEDAFGSAFAGKYESFFCVNQGSPGVRYNNFEEAVRKIFASTMSEDALAYRLQRKLDQMDEQMAILVQRVSGAYHKRYFFPELAGVGLSRNPFVWKKGMDEKAGMIRLVLGLGTRAVNRVENDYPRIVALDDPIVKPLSGMKDIRKYSQHFVDVLNLEANQIETVPMDRLLEEEVPENLELVGIRDTEAYQNLLDMGKPGRDIWVLTFDPFLTKTSFIDLTGKMLKRLENTYNNPVDIEFTINFNQENDIQINLLQCRPFQTIEHIGNTTESEAIPEEKIIVRTEGNFMGGNVSQPISRIIFVDPESYTKLLQTEKYSVARLIGKLNKMVTDREKTPTMLMGPGRWGTSSPEMGVPVNFSEINHITVLAELSYRDGSLIPDLSFGTHFFHDLIETGIFYFAVYPENPDVKFNQNWFRELPNLLDSISLGENRLSHVVKVWDLSGKGLMIHSNVVTQRMICYLLD
ncbi:MAG: PEP/pyruvate-binding domain-containing protein, partial [Proteobacteria bacterium]|nr:PEP/pyruvate-binding domain-containing protein [Pseudomonadota bacterium]